MVRIFQMKMKSNFTLILGLFIAAGSTHHASSQVNKAGSAWTHLTAAPANRTMAARWIEPVAGAFFQLDTSVLKAQLAVMARAEPATAKANGTELELPMPDGTMARFAIVEAPVMATELAAKFPEIKTYAGQGIDDPSATVRLDLTLSGFHAQVLSPTGTIYVDPVYRGDTGLHVSYYKRDYQKPNDGWACLTEGSDWELKEAVKKAAGLELNKVQSGAQLRTYQLAVACTGEYAAFFGGTVPNAMAAIVTAVNRINGVYETELAVRFVLVANNDLIVYTDSATDPYDNDDGVAMLGQNQTTINTQIGSANYDLGHVFSTGGGGVASLRALCNSSTKARGVTGSGAPTGDAFWIDYVAHEIGHQFGANHTFNSPSGSCSGNRNAATAFEPGSGQTIMAYAGICPPDDLQPHSDPFFHAGSLDEIQTFLSGSGGGCAEITATGNNAPDVVAGNSYTIPANTPFALTGVATDQDGDGLTYCWEEIDASPSAALLTAPDNGTIPLFRSFVPTASPTRYFPKFSSVLANTNWNQEKLPTTSRTMKFRLTVRDNRSGGAGVADGQVSVTSVSGTGPFRVTAPNTALQWSGARTVTWNVAGTANAPINTSGVNILLSTNGGVSFPVMLASNVANSGSATVVLPNITTSQARIMVQGTGNIFYDVSDVNFSIIPGSATPLVLLAGTTLVAEGGPTTNGVMDPYEPVTVNWSLINVGSSPTTNLVATLLTTNGIFYPGAAQVYGAISAGGTVSRAFTFTPVGTCGGSVTGVVQLVDGLNDMGKVTAVFALGATQTTVVTQTFSFASSITIRDNNTALPYPATIAVSGVSAPITKVTAILNGVSHTWPNDLGILLVGPGGQKIKLFGAAGGSTSLTGSVITFDDTAMASLPASGGVPSGTYLPTDYASSQVFNSPAPAGPYGATLLPLAASPNGTWSLYVRDFADEDSGSISGGWSLRFVTTTSTTNCSFTLPAPTLASTTYSNNVVRFSWNAFSGLNYRIQSTTNLVAPVWANVGGIIPGTNTTMTTSSLVGAERERYYRVLVQP